MTMPPRVGSRYSFSWGIRDSQGRLFLTDREPYGYHDHPDNRVHVVMQGDTLFHLAGRYFAPLPRACGYWWAIADFQPDSPILDPTLELQPGSRIWIPSTRVLTDVVLSDAAGRRQ
jgi:hypothetical protein